MKKTNEKGITLIALVVTVIVVIILAGVSISMLTGQNGILDNASKAKRSTSDAGDLEYLQVKAYDILTDYLMKGRTKQCRKWIYLRRIRKNWGDNNRRIKRNNNIQW